MNIGELFHSLKRDDVLGALVAAYPDQVKNLPGYERAWADIVGLQPSPTKHVCRLDLVKADPTDPEDSDRIDVCGIEIGGDGTKFAMDLSAWEQWLSMDVVVGDGIADMAPETVLAHVLSEMTWAGFDRETVAGQLVEIKEKVEEIEERHRAAGPRPN